MGYPLASRRGGKEIAYQPIFQPSGVALFDVKGRKPSKVKLRAHRQSIVGMAFSADGAVLVTTDAHGAVFAHDMGTGRVVRELKGEEVKVEKPKPQGIPGLTPVPPPSHTKLVAVDAKGVRFAVAAKAVVQLLRTGR